MAGDILMSSAWPYEDPVTARVITLVDSSVAIDLSAP